MTEGRKFDKPGIYRIRVKGVLDEEWSDWFEGLTITPQDDETLLTGPVRDQAALHGLLAKVRDLNLTLLSITRIEPQQAEAKLEDQEL